MSTVFGFMADLDAVELLFTSLLVQANAAMLRAGAKRDAHGRSRTRAFRQSLLLAYATRIGERLSQATEHAEQQAATASSGQGCCRYSGHASRPSTTPSASYSAATPLPRAGRCVRPARKAGMRAAADVATLYDHTQVTA